MAETAPRLRHVLVVDDGPWNRRLTASLLLKLGCTVDTAGSGLEAVCKVLTERYDLVLLDVHMEDLDGFATLRKIRAGEADSDRRTPVWALSADEAQPDQRGFDGWLVKPASLAMLRDVLAKLDGFDVEPFALLSDPAKLVPSAPVDAFPSLSEAARALASGIARTEPVWSDSRASVPP